jgi:NAD(P)-dependent dehydrogenase (short-subunit alcohol dehydrogenase family)
MRFLITGASSGLGQSIAQALRDIGHEIVTTGRSLPPPSVHWDFEHAPMSETTKLVRDIGPFDSIIHCAGAELVSPLRLTSDEQYRKAMMCADSAFAILRAAASKGVMTDRGSIVLMSSVAAHKGTAGMVAYSAGKAAIEGMVRAAAAELAPRRIRVNAIAAGAFHSPMHDRITGRMPDSAIEGYAKSHPLGFGSLEAVRDAVLGLLAEPWTTGTVRVVDGGYLA